MHENKVLTRRRSPLARRKSELRPPLLPRDCAPEAAAPVADSAATVDTGNLSQTFPQRKL